jgi:hypothetical protein
MQSTYCVYEKIILLPHALATDTRAMRLKSFWIIICTY